MILYTIQLSQYRKLLKTNIEIIDITIKSGKKIFAPSWEMVLGIKNKTLSEHQYIDDYRHLMSNSLKNHTQEWRDLILKTTPLALGCYCGDGQFCHRYQLVEIFRNLCFNQNINFDYKGEFNNEL